MHQRKSSFSFGVLVITHSLRLPCFATEEWPRAVCARCSSAEESFLHCVRDCPPSVNMWNSLGFSFPFFFLQVDSTIWIKQGIKEESTSFFLVGLLWSWQPCNSVCLGHEPVQTFCIILEANRLAALMECYFLSTGPHNLSPRQVTWHASKEDVQVLNVDGSQFEETGNAGFGGSLRGGVGEWILGFSGYIGISNCAHAKLMAILRGLELAWIHSARKLICHTDSLLAVGLISRPPLQTHVYATLIEPNRGLLCQQWEV